jgi:hypothetical protein
LEREVNSFKGSLSIQTLAREYELGFRDDLNPRGIGLFI